MHEQTTTVLVIKVCGTIACSTYGIFCQEHQERGSKFTDAPWIQKVLVQHRYLLCYGSAKEKGRRSSSVVIINKENYVMNGNMHDK